VENLHVVAQNITSTTALVLWDPVPTALRYQVSQYFLSSQHMFEAEHVCNCSNKSQDHYHLHSCEFLCF